MTSMRGFLTIMSILVVPNGYQSDVGCGHGVSATRLVCADPVVPSAEGVSGFGTGIGSDGEGRTLLHGILRGCIFVASIGVIFDDVLGYVFE